MGNRSRTEIVGIILDSANGGETKTKIMYKAGLKYLFLRSFWQKDEEKNFYLYSKDLI
ncbi:MAG: winged helix-turn-helix domain-containing protein [Nitrososphaerales archaeon]|jgi:predicted transcriptional regulator